MTLSTGMNAALVLGVLLTAVGLVGYAVGVSTAYPGRSFSLTLVMAGLTLVAVRRAFGAGSRAP